MSVVFLWKLLAGWFGFFFFFKYISRCDFFFPYLEKVESFLLSVCVQMQRWVIDHLLQHLRRERAGKKEGLP